MKAWPVLALAALWGCSGTRGDVSADVTPNAPKVQAQPVAWPKDVAIHKNAKGQVECPVMHTAVSSPEKAQGYADYKGKRYYFCCGMCPGKFKENPSLYAEKDKGSEKASG